MGVIRYRKEGYDAAIVPAHDGKYVSYSDYETMRQSRDKLLELLKRVFAHKDDNICSSYPWYGIVRESKIGVLGEVLLAGPFFNRQQAAEQLEARRYHYGKHAKTWEFSGYYSQPFRNFYDEAQQAIANAEKVTE